MSELWAVLHSIPAHPQKLAVNVGIKDAWSAKLVDQLKAGGRIPFYFSSD